MGQLNPRIIKESFEIAKPIANDVVKKFYETLWETYPASKSLFTNVDMERQKKNLIEALCFTVDNLENTGPLVEYLKKLGARHTAYGTKPEHYDWVGDALLKTFAFFFKEKWTPELKEQWTIAYGVVANTMKAGATERAAQAA